MNSNTVDVQKVFSSIASKYDLLNTILTLNIDKIWRKQAIKKCNLNMGDKVLDLCCGTGQMVQYACKTVGQNTEVIGLDFNEEMLNVGSIRLNKILKDYKFNLIKGDCLNIPFDDNSFDCITIAFGLRNLPDKAKGLAEMYRVLKPGGKVVCLEISTPQIPIFKDIYNIYFNCVLPRIGYIGTGDKNAYIYLRNSVNNFMSKDELRLLFNKIGFKNTSYTSLSGGIVAIHYGRKI